MERENLSRTNTRSTHREPIQAVCVYVRNIVNLYQGISKLKLEINVNVPQLLCIVVSGVLNGEFERFGGFCVTVTIRYKKETRSPSYNV